MNRSIVILILLGLAILPMVYSCGNNSNPASSNPKSQNSSQITPTLSLTSTFSAATTSTPTWTVSNTFTTTPTPSPTLTPTNSSTSTPTITPTACVNTTAVGNGTGTTHFIAPISYVYLSQITLAGSGVVQAKDVTFNINAGTTGSIYVGLYTDSGGAPQSLMRSATVAYNLGWNSASLPFLYLQAGNSYWLALSPFGTATNPWAVASGSILTYKGSSSGLPALLGSEPATATGPISGYTMAAQLEYCQ